jgi:hypothetical protein
LHSDGQAKLYKISEWSYLLLLVLSMIERRLSIAIRIYLWGALLEDTSLFLMAWLAPDIWFRVFHGVVPAALDIALLRRSAGQWAAFALAQAITLWRWKKDPLWLVIVAGVRFSDLFTDISYVVAVPSLTALGWLCLLPPPLLNLIGVVIMRRGYEQARGGTTAP